MKKYFWHLIVLLHLLAFVWQIFNNNLYLTDSKEYLWAAENLKNGFLNCANPASADFLNPDFLTKRPPIYPLILLCLKSIFNSDIWVIFCQNVLSISILYLLIHWIQLSQKQVNNKLLMILLLLSPAQIIYANLIMSEIFLQFFIICAAFLAWKFLQQFKIQYFIGFQLLFCLAFLTKPVMYVFVIPLFVYSVYQIVQHKIWKLIVFACIPILVCLAYCQWNFYRTGYFHFSSIQKINLLTYNTYHFLLSKMPENEVDKKITAIQNQCALKKSYKEKCQCENQESFNILFSQEHIFAYSFAHLKGMFQLFLDPGRFDLFHFFGIQSNASGLLHQFHQNGISGVFSFLIKQPIFILLFILTIFIGNIFKLLAFILLPFFKRDQRMLLPYLLLIYVAVLTGPIGASRFLVPFLPIYFWLIHLFFEGAEEK